MKITKTELKNIIKECLKEELGKHKRLNESQFTVPFHIEYTDNEQVFKPAIDQAVKNACGLYLESHPEYTLDEEPFYLDEVGDSNIKPYVIYIVPCNRNVELSKHDIDLDTPIDKFDWVYDKAEKIDYDKLNPYDPSKAVTLKPEYKKAKMQAIIDYVCNYLLEQAENN